MSGAAAALLADFRVVIIKPRPVSTTTESSVNCTSVFHCAQSSVVRFSTTTIRMPPIVGVPFLLRIASRQAAPGFRFVRVILAKFKLLSAK